ncbi:MAG: hypothetical protein KDD62_07370 [Bdellovibrionales bacterium]|nr:hypothetical protein [Bdellovibrionales bacterium]
MNVTKILKAVLLAPVVFVVGIVGLSVVASLISFAYTILVQDREIQALNEKRKIAFQEIRPAFLKFHSERGSYPVSLEELVPDYLPELPEVILDSNSDDPALAIEYTLEENAPRFYFRTTHGPDSKASYDIESNSYNYEQ